MKSLAFLCFISFWSVFPTEARHSSKLNPKYDKPIYRDFLKVPLPQTTAELFSDNFHDSERLGKRSVSQEERVVVVLDGSESMGACVFEKQKRAMREMMKLTIQNIGTRTQFAAVTVSSSPTVNFNFLPSAQAAIKINTIPYPAGSTNIHAGLKKAEQLLLTGNYRTYRKVILLLTDGQSDDNQKTLDSANKLKKLGVQIFVIGVGRYGDGLDEIVKVASYPPENFVFRIDKNHVFQLALHRVSFKKYKLRVKPPKSLC